MKKSLIVALSIACIAASEARGLGKAAPVLTPLEQVFRAELVFVGKVTGFEKDPVEAVQFPDGADAKAGYLIANVKVTENLLGAKGLTHVRVGFVPVTPETKLGRRYQVMQNLVEGQECCFFLHKHHSADFHTQILWAQQLNASDENYKNQLTTIKKVVRAIESPMESLKAKEAADRQFAACALIMKYYTQPTVPDNRVVKQEAISADESKLILIALGEMQWGAVDPDGIAQIERVFWMLNLTPKEGWKQPDAANGQDINKLMNDVFPKWVKENADKHRIQRYVVTAKKQEK